MSSDQVLYEVRDRVAVVTLNRPEKLNAWTFEMQGLLQAALERAAADDEARVIVVTGAGRAFCAGADLERIAGAILSGEKIGRQHFHSIADDDSAGRDFDQPLSYPLKIGKPVIAAINGPVAGIGLCFTLFCDIRFIAAGSKVTTAFSRRGLIAEYGSAWMLRQLIGPMLAADWLYSSRTMLADEVAAAGLAKQLPAEGFLDAVMAYAIDLAGNCSPRSLRVMKQQIWGGLNQTLAQACVSADREMLACFDGEDFKEGVASYFEKRAPRFSGK
jgi:enoyl-CoA hydratase/carnithine racemase